MSTIKIKASNGKIIERMAVLIKGGRIAFSFKCYYVNVGAYYVAI